MILGGEQKKHCKNTAKKGDDCMSNIYRFYVHKLDGKVTRLARLGGTEKDFGAYGYENGKWVEMPGLWKIENDITDYEEISAEEAKKLMEVL